MLLVRLQRLLEGVYRIETALDVADFVIPADLREELRPIREAPEQLLVAESDGELELGLFMDDGVMRRLATRDPHACLDEDNLADFLLTVEGVSHFVYLAWRAQRHERVSALELELQAEVDKYLACLITLRTQDSPELDDLRERLYERFALAPGLSDEERQRYLTANQSAKAYAALLDERYVSHGSLDEMIRELRHFYRLSGHDKIDHIAKAA